MFGLFTDAASDTALATQAPAPQAIGGADARNMLDRAIVLQIELSRLGVRRKVAAGAVQTDADRELLHVSKAIIDSDELRAIERADGDLRRYVASRASGPAFLNRGGFHLLAYELVESTDDEITRRLLTRTDLVSKFVTVYEQRKDETRARLGSLAADVDYPDVGKVLRSFGARVRYMTFDTPTKLEGIKREIFEREREKAAGEWAEALQECRQVLRSAFAELIDHLVDRLGSGEDGKPRKFKDSLVRNFSEFADTFSARNIADDRQLAALVERARDVMNGIDAQKLRTDEAMRAAVARSMADLKTAIDPLLVVDVPTRRYNEED